MYMKEVTGSSSTALEIDDLLQKTIAESLLYKENTKKRCGL